MPILQLVMILIAAGILLGLVNWFAPQLKMDGTILRILNIVVVIAVVLWLLSLFGLFDYFSGVRVGRHP